MRRAIIIAVFVSVFTLSALFAVVVQSQSVSASIVAAPSSVSFAPPIGPAFSPEVTAIDNPAFLCGLDVLVSLWWVFCC